MPTYRTRGESTQAIVRIKRGGAIIHHEVRTFPNPRLAKSWAEGVEAAIKRNGVPQRKLQATTLSDLLAAHLQHLETHSVVRRTKSAEINQLMPYFLKTPLSSITSKMFADFAIKRRAEGAGPTTVLHNLATIRAVLNAARPIFGHEVDGEPVSQAMSALMRTGAVSRSAQRDRRPTEDELQRLAKEFDRIAPNPSTIIPMRTIIELAVAWPRRLGELCEMRWEDHDPKRHLMTLRDTKHPSKVRTEVVPLTQPARRILAGLAVLDERVLPYNSESVSAAFERACKRLNIDDLRFHDLRHEGVSRLFEQGLQIQEVAVISGHMSWAMLRRYTHLSVSSLSEKLNAGIDQAPETNTEPA